MPLPFLSLRRGLLDIAFDPNFAANSLGYAYSTVPGSGGSTPHNLNSRFFANGDVAAGSEQILVELDPLSGATNPYGGAIHFGTDGKLDFVAGSGEGSAFRVWPHRNVDSRMGPVRPVVHPRVFVG